jgi:ribosomal protein S12 methylthiotransferase
MAEGLVLPYLDIPFQHASPDVLRRMRRPANDAKVLQRIRAWREQVPNLAIRSSFVVGFPGETEQDFQYLLSWLEEAQLDRVGAFKFEAVEGAPATTMDDQVLEDVKQERYAAVMALSARISAEKLAAKVGSTIEVLIDAVDAGTGGATGRSNAHPPQNDGEVHQRDPGGLKPRHIVTVRVEDSDEHDLYAVPLDRESSSPRSTNGTSPPSARSRPSQ